jgi:hypothetical protein
MLSTTLLISGCARKKVVDLNNLPAEAEPTVTFQLPGKNNCETECSGRFNDTNDIRKCQEFCRCVYKDVGPFNNPTIGTIMRCFQDWVDKIMQ